MPIKIDRHNLKELPQHPFSEFDQSQLKLKPEDFDNPIAQLLAKYIIFEQRHDGQFLSIPFPTGIGKTYNLIYVVYEAVLQRVIKQVDLAKIEVVRNGEDKIEPNTQPLFMFITNSIHNVEAAYKKLCSFINEDNRLNIEQKKWLKEQLIYTPNISTSLKECITDGSITELLEIFSINSPIINEGIATLVEQIKTLDQAGKQADANNHTILSVFEDNVDQSLRDTFSQIYSLIVKTQHSETAIDLTPSQINTVAKLLPAVRMEYNQAQAIFLTTKKFLFGIHQTRGKYHFVNDMSQHTLIIDEVDRQNDEILGHLVTAWQVDVLSKAKTIHSNLNFSSMCSKPQYAGIAELIEDYANGLTEFITQHRLHLSFNMDKTLSDLKPNPLLFSDKLATHTTNLDKQSLYFKEDQNIHQNIIYPINNNQGSDDLDRDNQDSKDGLASFSPFLNQLDQWVNRRLNFLMMAIIDRFKKNTHSLDSSLVNASSQEALASILHQLNLHSLQQDIQQQLRALSGRKHRYQGHDGTYHTRGISLIEIDRPSNTKDSVFFHHHGFDVSPTGMIASYVEQGATVIGVSATANCKSVIHNFDIGYLTYRLGSSFLELSTNERNLIENYYQTMRNYDGNDVFLHTIVVEDNAEPLLTAYCKVYSNGILPNLDDAFDVEKLKVALLDKLNLIDDGKEASQCFYKLEWLNKLCQAIENFYKSISNGNRYMVAMLNRFANKETQKFFKQYINILDSAYSTQAGKHISTEFFGKLNAHYLKSDKFENKVRATLSNTKKRVIVLTTYQTLSSGANPDYKFADWEKDNLISVAPEAHSERTDIDTMYLEKVTNIISASHKPDKALESRLTLLAQGMALQEAGQLSNNEVFAWTKKVISDTSVSNASNQLKKEIYNARNDDYISACCRDIEQAIGRSNRTSYKRPHIYLMFDEKLVPILIQDDRPNAIVSHEYKALVDCAKQFSQDTKPLSNHDLINKKQLRRLQSNAQKKSKRANKHINTLLNKINKLKLVEDESELIKIVNNWNHLRELFAITPNSNSLPNYPNEQYYLEIPDSISGSGYHYTYVKETDFTSYQFFDGNFRPEVSERDCKLTIIRQNSIIQDYFEAKGYTLYWSVEAKYFMTPPIYKNIYKGFLGEAGGTAILEHFGFEILELPIKFFEEFDNVVTYNNHSAWIDFKHWDKTAWGRVPDDVKKEAMEKFSNKVKRLSSYESSNDELMTPNTQKLIICNLMDDINEVEHNKGVRFYDENFVETPLKLASIMTISGLIDSKTGSTNTFAIDAIKQWLV